MYHPNNFSRVPMILTDKAERGYTARNVSVLHGKHSTPGLQQEIPEHSVSEVQPASSSMLGLLYCCYHTETKVYTKGDNLMI